MAGATRPRMNFFTNQFRKLGFIKYNGGLQINNSLLGVVLHDREPTFRVAPDEVKGGPRKSNIPVN
jgi:hypothetical protein